MRERRSVKGGSGKSRIPPDFLETTALPERPLAALGVLFSGQRARLATAACLYVVKHSPVWIAPILTARIIDEIVRGGAGAFERSIALGLALAAAIAQNIPSHTAFVRLLNGCIRKAEARTRMALIARLQQLDFGFHDRARSGALQNKVLRDVENIGTMVSQSINTVLSTCVMVAVALAYTLSRKPVIALFYLVAAPISVGILRVFGKRVRDNTQSYRKALEGMSVKVTELLTMLPVTRAHAVEEYELGKISLEMEKVASSGKRQDILNGVFAASSWVAFQLSSLASLLVSGYLAIKGEIPIGDVVLYQGFFSAIVGGVSSMVAAIPDLTKGFNAIQSVGEVLRAPDIERSRGKAAIESVEGAFSFRELRFRYAQDSREVLDGIDLEVEAGETIALVGESGSGKSTLMNLVIGLYRPSSGRILLDGRDMEELDLRGFRRRLSVVGQNTILFSGSIRDNVTYGLDQADDNRLREALVAAKAWDFIQALPAGLDTQLGERGSRLSGGQRQRIAIARALIRDPRVIIMDEATNALDVDSERQVQAAIERLLRGRTAFVVAHRLSTVTKADRIAVLKRGRLAELGGHEELLRAGGEYSRLHYLSFGFPAKG
jgi:ATP-binding cassette, subfamily B, bacterial